MLSVKGELVGLSPRKASLRNNRPIVEDPLEPEVLHTYANDLSHCKNVNVNSDFENNKRKRRESNEASGSDKDESRRQLIVPKLIPSPTVNLSEMELKKCKFETDRERMFRVSGYILKVFNK